MKITLCALALAAGSMLTAAAPLMAQPTSPEGTYTLNVSLGGSVQETSFDTSSTFSSFNEQGQISGVQNVGRGFVFDATGGYQITTRIGAGFGIWSQTSDSAAALTVLVPDPLFYNRFSTVNLSDSDLSQTAIGFNFQIFFTQPITDRIDMTFSGGPTIIHVKQEVAAATVAPNSTTATLSVVDESATTAKAGNIGVDVSYKMGLSWGLGGFIRYAGGKAELPSAPDLSVGGVQMGAGVRFRF
jgi:opacity protein-like surface antigen